MQIAEPIFPLSPAAFKAALASGHGRAMIHARRHGLDGLKDLILEATCFSAVYDTQCNGYAAPWVAELCRIAGVVDEFIAREPERVDLSLRSALLKEFVMEGHVNALPALYASCRFVQGDGNFAGLCEIIDIEGERGFLFAARKMGEHLLAHSDWWVDEEIVDRFDSQAGPGCGMALLEEGCRQDPALAAFYWGLQKHRKRRPSVDKPRPHPSVSEMIERIHLGGEKIFDADDWGKDASPEEREQVAGMDFRRLPVLGLWNYLHYFSGIGLPMLEDAHLELLRHPDEGVRDMMVQVLSHHADERVRQEALRALGEGELYRALELFHESVRPEDMAAILEALDSPQVRGDIDFRHSVSLELIRLLEGPAPDLDVALWVYEHSPCMICRQGAVKVMSGMPDFPEWVARECRQDASGDIRKAVG